MKRQKVTLIVLGLMLMLVFSWYVGTQARPAYAQASPTIPKSWGTCKGGVGGLLIFEDGTGTIRLVDARNGALSLTYGR